jgi:signal transduction histidine kinase
MRFAVKSTLTLFALYLLILAGLAWWTERGLRAVVSSLMENTARLVGGEIAGAMSGSALDELLEADPVTRQRLTQILADVTRGSNVVASIAVVDRNGQVVVSDEIETGRQLAPPAVIFQGAPHPQFLSALSPFTGGQYHLFVPLMREDEAVGYIRLSLHSQHIAGLYRRAVRQIGLAAIVGFTCIGGLGFLLHLQLSRRGAAVARALEATARGERVPAVKRRDEFSAALEAAGRIGRELSETRERSTQAERRVSALANFMDVGVLLLGSDQRLEFANAAAQDLFGCRSAAEWTGRWEMIKPALLPALARLGPGRSGSARVDLDLPLGERARRLRLEVYRPGEDERDDVLVLVKDREQLDAFETDLRLASQMRSLAGIYGALAHELKAPLGAMALNLELLNDALHLDADETPALRERRQRYATVLRAELARLNRSLVSVLSQTSAIRQSQERFDLREVVRDLEALLTPQAKQQRVDLTVALPESGILLAGHRDRLKQALLNIATNALEAMPDGGSMGVSVNSRHGHATVSIRDTGPGIPPDILGKIYGMYFTTKNGGTGIGLYVARSIVESHGGDIRVLSEAGQGTCFQVAFPLSSESA